MHRNSTPHAPKRPTRRFTPSRIALWVFVVLSIGFIYSAIVGDPDTNATPEPTQDVATEAPTETPAPTEDDAVTAPYFDQFTCRPAPDHLVDEMRTGMLMNTDLDGVVMVRSEDHQQVWFVAGVVSGGDLDADPAVGIWGTTMLDANGDPDPAGGSIYSVGGVAHGWSSWPETEELSMTDEAAHPARQCAEDGQ